MTCCRRNRGLGWLALLGLAGCGPPGAAPVLPGPAPVPPGEGPDVVLVLIDTLRPDYLEVGGETRETAPFLAELAGRSVLFRRAFSTSSWTAPATASVFTGLYPPTHGVIEGFFANEMRRENLAGSERDGGDAPSLALRALPRSRKTLAEHFRAAGYQTLGLASNVNIGPELGFDRGFDLFSCQRQASAADLFATLRAWRAELAVDRPHFFYLHLNDVHKPYDGRAPWYSPGTNPLRDDIARYRSEIRYVDDLLRRLFAEMAWGPETATLVLSDHGEAFKEHGMRGHDFSLHGEVNRVLMILSPPDWSGGARILEQNVSLLDVLPTLLDLIGREEEGLEGRSLLPLLRDDPGVRAGFEQRTLFAHRESGGKALWAAIQGDWKLILNEWSGQKQLFDTRLDPRERTTQLEPRADVAERLELALDRFRTEARPLEANRVEVPLDEELLRHLDDLGYTDKGEE